LLTFISMRAAGEARATPPPIFEPDDALDSAWEDATEAFKLCATRADAGRRAGTVWVDVWVPAHGGDHERARGRPTFNVRTSPGLVAADRACVQAVVARQVLPDMPNIAYESDGETITNGRKSTWRGARPDLAKIGTVDSASVGCAM